MWITYRNKAGQLVRALPPLARVEDVIDLVCYWNVAGYVDCDYKPRIRPITKDSGASPGFVSYHHQWWLK